jgi:hypothetical protein
VPDNEFVQLQKEYTKLLDHLQSEEHAPLRRFFKARVKTLEAKLDNYSEGERGVMPVGDVNSEARGSGARYNDGKIRLDLVPAYHWANTFHDASLPELRLAAGFLRDVQHWDRKSPAPSFSYSIDDLTQAAKVFEYGSQKYAAWNWAKGMNWSIPIGCALRHMTAIALDEVHDEESGHPHWGHVMCNLIMLEHFMRRYPEGDDVAIPLCQTS